MRSSPAIALAIVSLAGALCSAELPPAVFAVGFGVGVPYELPVAWDQSFSYLTSEVFLSRNRWAASHDRSPSPISSRQVLRFSSKDGSDRRACSPAEVSPHGTCRLDRSGGYRPI
ncbi:hypothetical protein ACFLSF_05015 [Candidatus Bipolaricaulota bacterium]